MIQRKLVVGSVSDPAEAEADRVADEVLRRIADQAGDAPTGSTVTAVPAPAIGRIRRSATTIGAAGGAIDADTEHAIGSSRGNPLAPRVRRSMESAFGADFSGVRVHTDAQSDALNDRLSARAFTSGNDIFVRRDAYSPDSAGGQRLLAHELTHTLQQSGSVNRLARDETDEIESAETETAEAGETEGNAPETANAESAESESAENETEEPGEDVVTFSLPNVTEESPPIAAGAQMEDRAGSRPATERRPATRDSTPGKHVLSWDSDLATAASSSRDDSVRDGATDTLSLKKTALKPSTTNNLASTPFGAMDPSFSFTGLTVQYSKKQGKLRVNGTLGGLFDWGVNDGGRVTDVPSATAPVVTAENYQQIVSDLTPKLIEKSWRAPRSQYWSKAICERHEKYHATDFSKWFNSKARGVVEAYLGENPITVTEEQRKDLDAVKQAAQPILSDAMVHLRNASMEYYMGGATSYLSYKGEEKAFGDGKAPYVALAKGVAAQGKKLAKAKSKATGADAGDTTG